MAQCVADQFVLVVVEDSGIQQGLAREMRKCGCRTDQVQSVEAAISEISAHRYDTIFCDLAFSGELQGTDLLTITKNRYPDTDIVFVSNAMHFENRTRLIVQGAKFCLQLPIYEDTCHSVLKMLAENTEQQATLSPTQ